MPKFLSIKHVIEIHEHQLAKYGGDSGLRDLKLLESAVYMPQSGMGGEYFHPDVYAMAAANIFHIIQNHPFVDGNKRTGVETANAFLTANGLRICCSGEQLVSMVLMIAEGKLDKEQIGDFFRLHTESADSE